MKYVPSLPPPVTGAGAGLAVKAVAGIRRVKPVQVRTSPPLAAQPHARREVSSEAVAKQEKRHDPLVHGERRIYCRRIEHLPTLVELRLGTDRRRHNQRIDDTTEHVDVKV